ncbi:CHAT domain-containing protein [Sphingosinicella sp. BN140058]|uniref:CHAT domain-containing protein n=1 Tax=Sphingosinicella sp. BN140058 TaxID=1892855 RepID=UPI001012C15F|nr:CHAT domain-containing protein [Sphingosinicella sp. BN140058]QAY77222.1 CHAT domain-containing protein [Sphingosinicella sp. BN140058]
MMAAERAEQLLRSDDPESLQEATRMLEIGMDDAVPPAARSLARYCAAAGETMRRSPEGSQAQAQSFLTTAFRTVGPEAPELSALAAYRLGLVALAAPGSGTSRGSKDEAETPRQARSVTAADLAVAERSEIDSCGDLSDRNLARTTNAYLSMIALQCAAARALRNGDTELSALAGLRLVRFWLALSRNPAEDRAAMRRSGLEAAIRTLPAAAVIPAPDRRAEVLGRLLATMLDLGGAEPQIFSRGLATMREGQPTGAAAHAYADEIEARLALAGGDAARAVALAERALLLESSRPLPARLPGLYLLLAAADPADRDRHNAAALAALETLRPLLPRLDPLTEESTFSLYMRDVFEQAADVALTGAAADPARIDAAQIIIEASRQAELQNAVGSECLPPRDALKPQDLAAGEIVLYPLLLPDRIELLTLSGSEVHGTRRFRRLPPDRSANRDEVARLVEAMVLSTTYGDDTAWQAPARRLYQLLIAPIENQLGPESVIAIIPDGPLRALPFAALVDADGRFLAERSRIVVAPALGYLQPGEIRGNQPMRVVAASLQHRVRLPAGAFPALASTAAEAEIAAASGAPGEHLANFRRTDLARSMAAGPVDILHLATHASFDGRSDRAFIVADGEVIRLRELRDIIGNNLRRGDSLDLLVLSACETAVGDDEASMGLAGAAVQAGAVSALASLWQVDDAGTAELMRLFYAAYGAGRSRSAALREAQIAMIRSRGEQARPHIWAAFTLLGAWR